jgi:hypothetical protein
MYVGLVLNADINRTVSFSNKLLLHQPRRHDSFAIGRQKMLRSHPRLHFKGCVGTDVCTANNDDIIATVDQVGEDGPMVVGFHLYYLVSTAFAAVRVLQFPTLLVLRQLDAT